LVPIGSGFRKGKCKSLWTRTDIFAGLNIVKQVHVLYTSIIALKHYGKRKNLVQSMKSNILERPKAEKFFPIYNILHFSLT
jgi:hypothetical protein